MICYSTYVMKNHGWGIKNSLKFLQRNVCKHLKAIVQNHRSTLLASQQFTSSLCQRAIGQGQSSPPSRKRWLRDTCRTLDFLQDTGRQTEDVCWDMKQQLFSWGERKERILRGDIRPGQHTYRLIKVIKEKKHSSTSRTHTNILMLPCAYFRQKVVPYWSSTQRCHKSYKRPSGRIFCHHYCGNECSAKMNVGPHRMGLNTLLDTPGHSRLLCRGSQGYYRKYEWFRDTLDTFPAVSHGVSMWK